MEHDSWQKLSALWATLNLYGEPDIKEASDGDPEVMEESDGEPDVKEDSDREPDVKERL